MQFRVVAITDPPTHEHTDRHDRLQYTAPQLASAQCNYGVFPSNSCGYISLLRVSRYLAFSHHYVTDITVNL